LQVAHGLTFTLPKGFVRLMCMAHPAGTTKRPAAANANTAVITSRENQWLKRFRSALAGEHGEGGIVGVEGVRLVEAALGSSQPVDALLVSESGARHLQRLKHVLASVVPVLRTSDKMFASLADTQTPQGIAALIRPRPATIESLVAGTALLVVLVGVQDPGNVGTIVRAAEAFGATGVATCSAERNGTADPFGPKALRASAGSALRLPIVHGTAAAGLLTKLRECGVKVYAAMAATVGVGIGENSKNKITHADSSALLCPWDIDWKTPAAILIGNEGAGLPAEVVGESDTRVYIPQATAIAPVGIESLNAAMAASVLLYEAMRQRKNVSHNIS
jgi:TrmH family RNA methyltransferase